VGSGSLKVLEQPALAGEFEESIMELLSRAESQIGQASFVANISDHCTWGLQVSIAYGQGGDS